MTAENSTRSSRGLSSSQILGALRFSITSTGGMQGLQQWFASTSRTVSTLSAASSCAVALDERNSVGTTCFWQQFYNLTNTTPQTFPTPDGVRVRGSIQAVWDKYQLGQVMGCAAQPLLPSVPIT